VVPLLLLALSAATALPLSARAPSALSEVYGPYDYGEFYAVILWVPCESAGSEGVATLVLYPKQPRYDDGAPVVVYVQGGPYSGFFPLIDPDWNPAGIVWVYFLFPGGSTEFKLPSGEKRKFSSGGSYDYRGPACYAALYAVLRFAQGELAAGCGKRIGDFADYEVLTDNVGMYGSSYGGVMAAMVFHKYPEGLEGVKYVVFYESPAANFLTTTDLGRVGEDRDWRRDADGDGLPWNDARNPTTSRAHAPRPPARSTSRRSGMTRRWGSTWTTTGTASQTAGRSRPSTSPTWTGTAGWIRTRTSCSGRGSSR